MLQCVSIPSPDAKLALIHDQIGQGSLFVVPDLESKFWLQKVMRHQQGHFVGGEKVLRASELWQKLLLQIDPHWHPLPPQMSQFLIEKWMGEILRDSDLKLSQRDCRRAFQTIGQILPLLSHFQGQDVMEEWFKEHEDAKERWFEWYKMGSLLWQLFLERKLIPQEWMKAVLLNEALLKLEHQSLVFDLGLEIDDVESELILNLSRDYEVTVFVPEESKPREAYEQLMARCQPQKIDYSIESPKHHFKKLPTMLSEVKEAVGQARIWLDEGVPAENIAIVSTQIENYWPTLSEHLQVEGVPANKGIATPLSQFPIYQTWLAKMRLSFNDLRTGDGELVVYQQETPAISHLSFQQLFKNVFDVTDFERMPEISADIPQSREGEEKIDLESFLEWAFSLMPMEQWPALNELVNELDEVIFINETLSFHQWMDFFEHFLSRTERKVTAGQSEGIHILPLNAVHNATLSHVLLLGLSESNLLDAKDTALSWTDIESIKLNFGFNLPHADRQHNVDLLNWFEKKSLKELVCLHSEVDFSGQFQAPSLYWLQGALQTQDEIDLEIPLTTRWDELMAAKSQETGTTLFDEKIARDLGLKAVPPLPYSNLTLSASSLEEFFKCPFKFFAYKGLHLSNLPSLDLDVDYMSRGRLMHRVCEVVVQSGNFDFSDEQVEELVDQAKEYINAPVYSDTVWEFLRPYYIEVTKSFLSFEKDWREKFPATQSFAVEASIRAEVSIKNDKLEFVDQGGIPLRGTIDRMDRNQQGQVVILDYKSSDNSLTAYKSWLKNGKIQLALYALALVEGVLGSENKDVVGAYYFGLKEMQRKKGFALEKADSKLLKPGKINDDEFKDFMNETRLLLRDLVSQLQAGVIEPRPHDEKLCEQCDWNKICRYPNLNQ